jgi:transposase
MLCVGLDIHSKRISLCVLNETGQIAQRGQVRTIDQMMRILEGLPDRFEVCCEASCGYGHFHDLLRPVAARVLVAHPGRLRLIFRSSDKNDRKVAERLAKLLYLGEVPAVHVPSQDVRTWRELINCRSQMIAKRTRAKNTMRALLRSAGETPPRHPSLWTKKGVTWLRQLSLPTASQQLRRDILLEEIDTLNRQLRRLEQELNRRAQQTPAVSQLRSIPGVGARTAEALAAFVDDPHRFRNAKSVGRYFGLVPRQDQSGERNRLGHITREGAPWFGSSWQKRPGKRGGDRRPYAPSSIVCSRAIHSARKSRSWPPATTWCGPCGRCSSAGRTGRKTRQQSRHRP